MKKDILKHFLIYGILPSLITTFIFYIVLTTYLSKTFDQLEEEVDSIILEVTLKEEINENVDIKLEKLDEEIERLNDEFDSKINSITKRIDNLYLH